MSYHPLPTMGAFLGGPPDPGALAAAQEAVSQEASEGF